MKTMEVRYASGQDVLKAYWGYLTGGGLRLSAVGGVGRGDEVCVRVVNEASGACATLLGEVMCETAAGDLLVAFSSPDSQQCLFTAALSDLLVDVEGMIAQPTAAGTRRRRGRITSVSRQGCRIATGDEEENEFALGTHVEFDGSGIHVGGYIVASGSGEHCMVFDDDKTCEFDQLVAIGADPN